MASKVSCFRTALERIGHRSDVTTEKIVTDVLRKQVEVSSIPVAGVLPSGKEEMNKIGGKTLISKACLNFWNFLYKKMAPTPLLQQDGYAYSPMTQSFVKWKLLQVKKQYYYTECRVSTTPVVTPSELEAFSSLVGPAGVRVVEGFLMDKVRKRVMSMYTVVKKNKSQIGNFKKALSKTKQLMLPVLQNFTSLDSFLESAVIVGNIFYFRDMLRRAQGVAGGTHAPILQDWANKAVEVVQSDSSDNMHLSAIGLGDASRLHGYHQDAVKTGHLDDDVVTMMRGLSKDDTDHLWELLPYLFAASFISNIWKGGLYLPHIQANANSTHAVSITVQKLLTAHAFVQGGGCRQDMVSLQKQLRAPFKTYLTASSRVLLEMRRMVTDKEFAPMAKQFKLADLPLRSCFVFLEMVVDACGDLIPHSMLEKLVPHALVLSSNIDIILGVQFGTDKLEIGSLSKVIHVKRRSPPPSNVSASFSK